MFNFTTQSQIEAMSTKHMVIMFNTITGLNITKFKNRADGINRLIAAIAASN